MDSARLNFDLQATNACKGVALLLMLWHHLFRPYPQNGSTTHVLALVANVCLAMFIMLSGYGLAESVRDKNISLVDFYKRRLSKLYLNYWFVALVFIVIGAVFYDKTIETVYTGKVYRRFIAQMAGLQHWAPIGHGFNKQWWLMSLIVPLYLLFPFIYQLTIRYRLWFIGFTFLPLIPVIPISLGVLQLWIFPFALGIFLASSNAFVKISNHLHKLGLFRFAVLAVLIGAVGTYRQIGPVFNDIKTDWLLGILIMILTFEATAIFHAAQVFLSFLGKHLFNIFLFHAFVYYYYWRDLIYYFEQPVLIFLVMLAVCVAISVALEFLKKITGFNKLLSAIGNTRLNWSMQV